MTGWPPPEPKRRSEGDFMWDPVHRRWLMWDTATAQMVPVLQEADR